MLLVYILYNFFQKINLHLCLIEKYHLIFAIKCVPQSSVSFQLFSMYICKHQISSVFQTLKGAVLNAIEVMFRIALVTVDKFVMFCDNSSSCNCCFSSREKYMRLRKRNSRMRGAFCFHMLPNSPATRIVHTVSMPGDLCTQKTI